MIRSRSVSPGRPVLLAGLLLLAACSGAIARTAPGPRQPNPALRSGPFDIDFLQNIVVGEAPCDDCQTQVCAGEPVEVTVSGLLPSTCYRFLGLRELVELPFPAVAAEFFVQHPTAAARRQFRGERAASSQRFYTHPPLWRRLGVDAQSLFGLSRLPSTRGRARRI